MRILGQAGRTALRLGRETSSIVEGTPGLRFGWELKGRQRDLDQRRLDAPIEQAQGTDSDFGAMALAHIEQIYEGRMQA